MFRPPRHVLDDMNALFGSHMPNYTFKGTPDQDLFSRVVEQAKAAEAAGFDMVTVMDHFYQIRGIGPETEPMLEAYTTLAALAMSTSRVKLGTLVTGVTYRNPAVLAKMVTTLDVISKGRAIFGLGAAWNEDEHKGYGIEFPPIGKRMDRLDEALTIAKLMFTQERPSFEGTYYKIDRALNVPRPIQPGGPKILIGGGGERRTLRLLAQHGDIGHWFSNTIEELKRKKQVFEEHCEAVKADLIGGGVERRTRRLLAQHGDIGHWFSNTIEELKRKKQVFEEHCEAVKRDPSEVLLTLGVPLVLAE